MSNNIFDSEGLDALFDIVVEETAQSEQQVSPQTETLVQNEEVSNSSADEFVDSELKNLLATSNKLMDTARRMIDSCPDAETIGAASSMISSISHIISEFNKAVLLEKRHQNQTDLEMLKINARKELTQLKAAQKAEQLQLGTGNTFIQNTTNSVTMSQDQLVDMIREQSMNALNKN